MESDSSDNASWSKSVRGWKGLTSISLILISFTEPIEFASEPEIISFLFGCTFTESFKRALNPLPKAFLFSALIFYIVSVVAMVSFFNMPFLRTISRARLR